MRNLNQVNKFDASCNLCSKTVKAGEGRLFATKGNDINFKRTKQPVWVVQHKNCKKDLK